MFLKKKFFNKFFEHDYDNYVIKIFSKKFFSINFIYNFSKTEFKMLRKYINENLKKKIYQIFQIFDKIAHTVCQKMKRKFAFVRKLSKSECHND